MPSSLFSVGCHPRRATAKAAQEGFTFTEVLIGARGYSVGRQCGAVRIKPTKHFCQRESALYRRANARPKSDRPDFDERSLRPFTKQIPSFERHRPDLKHPPNRRCHLLLKSKHSNPAIYFTTKSTGRALQRSDEQQCDRYRQHRDQY